MAVCRSSFFGHLGRYQSQVSSLLCVGIDPDPDVIGNPAEVYAFCENLVKQTAPFVCAFKIQVACFAANALENDLRRIIDFIHLNYPNVSVILDSKRGDIPSTACWYARECFGRYCADATTVQPYLGADAILPFSSYDQNGQRGVFVLCKTSNLGSSDLQELRLEDDLPVYMSVARMVSKFCSSYDNCGLVVGATYPDAIAHIRLHFPDVWLLIPGVGAQGGSLERVMDITGGYRVLITVSRSVIYPSRFFTDKNMTSADAALAIRDQINLGKLMASDEK
ncbi:orotidine-5'-phosphate decarboxylase [Candidatus Ichthyocystis sparus]|uniref:Orotidine-5'-phosphate decarboxylase n=2 Tax=Candidatus Ichthyocystis hellenicum TaxID=1561003 RepID=A0A0S4M6L2_9BURK|nr:orotidine-5'-phosphate decarboxylase [Candidatus Ichthyocystis sparus]CUT17901.1 orotidine 5'-phosphate decarboxylase [Candidatus Ichthyocystis hellenicum]